MNSSHQNNLLPFSAVVVEFGPGASPEYLSAGSLVAGVFLGSAMWWVILSGMVALLRSAFGAGWMSLVNRLSGGVILAFGLYSLWIAFR